jgi:hypothetical protein
MDQVRSTNSRPQYTLMNLQTFWGSKNSEAVQGANAASGAYLRFLTQMPGNPASGQTPPAGGRGIVSKLGQAGQAFSSVTSAAAEQAAFDRSRGIGILEGAERAGQNMLEAYEQVLTREDAKALLNLALSARNREELKGIVDEVGQAGQSYLMNQFQTEAAQYIGRQVGIDLEDFGGGSLLDGVLGGASGGATQVADAAAAGVEGAAAAEGANAAAGEGAAASLSGLVLGFAGAAYSVYGLISNWGRNNPLSGALQGATAGAYIGSCIVPGIGTLVGGAIGAIAGGLLGCLKTGKSKAQLARDGMRDFLQQNGIIDRNWGLRLADGSRWDMGKDGGFKLQNLDGTDRRAYEVDASNPLAGQVIGWLQPLAAALTGGDETLKNQLTGYMTNAALSNAKDLETARANALCFYQDAKADPEKLAAGLMQAAQQGGLSKEASMAYVNGIKMLFERGAAQRQTQTAAGSAQPE